MFGNYQNIQVLSEMLDAGCWMLAAGCWMRNAERKTLNAKR
jgi:hypothetical protein